MDKDSGHNRDRRPHLSAAFLQSCRMRRSSASSSSSSYIDSGSAAARYDISRPDSEGYCSRTPSRPMSGAADEMAAPPVPPPGAAEPSFAGRPSVGGETKSRGLLLVTWRCHRIFGNACLLLA